MSNKEKTKSENDSKGIDSCCSAEGMQKFFEMMKGSYEEKAKTFDCCTEMKRMFEKMSPKTKS